MSGGWRSGLKTHCAVSADWAPLPGRGLVLETSLPGTGLVLETSRAHQTILVQEKGVVFFPLGMFSFGHKMVWFWKRRPLEAL